MVTETKPFLSLVADDLKKTNIELGNTLLVFPNRRSVLFFNECWAGELDSPVFAPESTTIQELFHSMSPYVVPDEIALLIELYFTIKKTAPDVLGPEDSFDKFYFWGKTLLSDFDDIDKNRVNALALFSNVADLQRIKDFSYLTESQIKVLEHFFKTFSVDSQNEKIKLFAKLWENLYSIYVAFKEHLEAKGLAYEGMLMLDVVEKLKGGEIDDSKYEKLIFIGFNVLSRTEHDFFKRYRDSKRAEYYWDYDIFYSADDSLQEAGMFMRQNIADFPPALSEASFFDNYSKPKKITFVSTSSDSAQAGYVAKFLKDVAEKDGGKAKIDRNTAIVLCDETLLLPVLHSIPNDGDFPLNVTMGFPVSQTPIASLIQSLVVYHIYRDEHKPSTVQLSMIEQVTNHPYVKTSFPEVADKVAQMRAEKNVFPRVSLIDDPDDATFSYFFKYSVKPIDFINNLKKIVSEISKRQEENTLYSDLYKESLFRVYNILVRFADDICSDELNMSVSLVAKLLLKVIQQTKVPFSGEPIEGLQVMGFLETRGLDFSHICLVSASNKQLPPAAEITSFIPFSIRAGFDMTSIDQKNALFAYYFYRLVQRAEDVTLVYNSSCDGQTGDGQMSRYMLQMLVENKNFEIKKYDIQNMVPSISTDAWTIKKDDEIVNTLLNRYALPNHPLSPSAINVYFECPIKFYFKYVLNLSEPDANEDDVQANEFGTIFHAVMQEIYDGICRKNNSMQISKDELNNIKKEDIYTLIDHFINIHYYKVDKFKSAPKKVSQFHGHLLIARDMLYAFVMKQLEVDKSLKDLVYVASEEKVVMPMKVIVNGEERGIFIGGTVDRQDTIEGGKRRVVDYKTGGELPPNIESIDKLLGFTDRHKMHYPLQLLIYSSLVHKQKDVDIMPVLNFVNQVNGKIVYKVKINEEEVLVNDEFCDEFDEKLSESLSEIFSVDHDFVQTMEPEKNCGYCAFSQICRKK